MTDDDGCRRKEGEGEENEDEGLQGYRDDGVYGKRFGIWDLGGELKERRRPSLKECENTVYALRRQLLRSQETEVQKVQKSQNEREK